mmetsp:Transcript_49430/g.143321  ORF Transcript_49430/g.143321 Transcript_49430/m.143321 type:complete len:235 (-) Transcript_49430:2246-2950(-)
MSFTSLAIQDYRHFHAVASLTMYWYFRWCSRMINGICSSCTLTKPRSSISACSRPLDSTMSPLRGSWNPPSHCERWVNCSSHENGVTMRTTPPGFMTAARPSKQASGSGKRHSRLARMTPSKVPSEAASSTKRQASPVRKVTFARTASSTFSECVATISCRRSPSTGTLKQTLSARCMLWAVSMKDLLKSKPSTSSKPSAANSKDAPPTAQPRSKARPRGMVGPITFARSCATR